MSSLEKENYYSLINLWVLLKFLRWFPGIKFSIQKLSCLKGAIEYLKASVNGTKSHINLTSQQLELSISF